MASAALRRTLRMRRMLPERAYMEPSALNVDVKSRYVPKL
jgi:hypothetical protein